MRPLHLPRGSVLVAVLCLLAFGLLAGGCGGDEPANTTPAVRARRQVRPPSLPLVTDRARAEFALDRLVRGPLPRTVSFAIPDLHTLNITHARSDLVALPEEAQALLSDPKLVRALTRPERSDHNPWHNVLDVLAAWPDLSPELALAWTEPTLAQADVQLLRRAMRVLRGVPDERASAALLRLVKLRPTDRELVPPAIDALIARGSPWRERALSAALEEGSALLWHRVPDMLAPEARASSEDDALAWWALLTAATPPQPVMGVQRTTVPTWYPARLLVDPGVWPRDARTLQLAVHASRVLAPLEVADGGGTLLASRRASAVLPASRVHLEGLLSGALARCALARGGHAPHVASVEAERAGSDPALAFIANDCVLRDDRTTAGRRRADARDLVEQFLEMIESGFAGDPAGLVSSIDALLDSESEEGLTLAWKLMESARPTSRYMRVLEALYDRLRTRDEAKLVSWIRGRAGPDVQDPEEVGLALHLLRRDADARYVDVVATRLETSGAADVGSLRRLMIWLHGAGRGIDDARREEFTRTLVGWVDEAGDAEAALLVTGMLDLGDAGARAYAVGLRGPRRPVYLEGLVRLRRLVSPGVAEALLDALDAATPPAERHRILIAAYRSAPAAAAPSLAAARARLDPAVQREVDDVLEVVRHRAERDGR